MHALVTLSPLAVESIGPLPPELDGIDDANLADLSWVGEPLDAIYAGKGYWPVEVSEPVLGTSEVATGELVSLVPDLTRKVVATSRGKRGLRAGEVAALRGERLQALADRRWRAEEAGTTLPDGTRIPTDRTTQGKITAAYIKARENPAYTIPDWKVRPGVFTALDAASINAFAAVIEAHVQASFTREAQLTAAILAAADPSSVDIETGWPG